MFKVMLSILSELIKSRICQILKKNENEGITLKKMLKSLYMILMIIWFQSEPCAIDNNQFKKECFKREWREMKLIR